MQDNKIRKYLSPWMPSLGFAVEVRKHLDGSIAYGLSYDIEAGKYCNCKLPYTCYNGDLGIAKIAIDKQWIYNGYKFLSQDRYDKMKLLV
jgi:hypothetical protein